MAWIKKMNRIEKYVIGLSLMVFLFSCTVTYKFNGASIDYTKTKTIQIQPLFFYY